MKRIVFSKVRTLHNKDFSATMYEARVYLGSLFFDIGNLLCSASLGPYSGWQVPETFGIFWAVHILVQGKMTFSTSISVMDTLLSLVRVATKKLTENPGLFRTFQDSFSKFPEDLLDQFQDFSRIFLKNIRKSRNFPGLLLGELIMALTE